jgi:hypothetical protein
MSTRILFLALLLGATQQVLAAKPCEDLKGEIAAKIEANGVTSYTLTVVPNDQVGDLNVVGSCDGGTNKIVYERGTKAATPDTAAAPAPAPAAVPAKPDTAPPAPAK